LRLLPFAEEQFGIKFYRRSVRTVRTRITKAKMTHFVKSLPFLEAFWYPTRRLEQIGRPIEGGLRIIPASEKPRVPVLKLRVISVAHFGIQTLTRWSRRVGLIRIAVSQGFSPTSPSQQAYLP
jgi:hypothetical protein